jgi:hypothetical protein
MMARPAALALTSTATLRSDNGRPALDLHALPVDDRNHRQFDSEERLLYQTNGWAL